MLNKIKEIDMVYEFKSENEVYDYHLVGEIILSPDKKHLKFRMRKSDGSENIDDFDNIIVYDEEYYYIKSEYYENISEKYPLEVSESDGEVIFVQNSGNEIMTIYASI